MSAPTPEQGGRDFDHLKTEYDRLVLALKACRENRTAAAAYTVKLEDSCRGLSLALMTARDALLADDDHDPVALGYIDAAIARAALVLPSVTTDTRRKS